MPTNLNLGYPPGSRTGTATLPGMPDPNRTFATGIPGFDELSAVASGNVRNLLAGTESPDITRNINAAWGVGSGLAPGSEFLRNRAVDLYGKRSEARKQQGMQDLLAMLGTYSGTVVARPGEIMGDEAARRREAIEREQMAQTQAFNNAQLAQQKELEQARLDLENRRFDLQRRLSNPTKPPPSIQYRRYGPGIGGGQLEPYPSNVSYFPR